MFLITYFQMWHNLVFGMSMVVKIAIWIVGSHDFTILAHQNI